MSDGNNGNSVVTKALRRQQSMERKCAITVATEFPDRIDKQSASGIEIDKTEAARMLILKFLVKSSLRKMLHRALECSCSNVAEDEPISPGGPSALKTIVNGSLSQKRTEESVVQKSNSPSNGVCGNLAPPVEQNETVDEVNTCSQPSGTSSSPTQKAMEIAYSKDSVIVHSWLKDGSKNDPSEGVSEMHSDPISSKRENGVVLHDANLLQSSPHKSCNDNAMQ
nr:hypothetical protein [Tanacetum cinerariifolium]